MCIRDRLGGTDPYSASKASAELIIQSYVKSYFKKNDKISIGIARAGNVIGGGDWSKDRLVPDCVKSWSKNNRVNIRNPKSTRPWQHVLEAVGGYLIFATRLNKNKGIHVHNRDTNFFWNSFSSIFPQSQKCLAL